MNAAVVFRSRRHKVRAPVASRRKGRRLDRLLPDLSTGVLRGGPRSAAVGIALVERAVQRLAVDVRAHAREGLLALPEQVVRRDLSAIASRDSAAVRTRTGFQGGV